MPQRNDRSRSTPTTSPKNNSWFRMQAGHQSDADIYIYDEIGFWGVTAKQFISDLNALGDITHINLHINSPGGDVFEGIAIFNALKTHGASITVYVDGVAASMASVIAMVGNQVIRSSSVKGADINAGIINPVKDFATVIAEPRLDDNSQTTFYLAASKGSDTIEVAYLNGVDTPYIDQMEGFSVDGVTTKVRIDAGVAPVDHRGLVKCTA
ncbi:TPA: Clp protease ClpP [Escherichia coli]|nr:Clp protease ClpP [Escherichia coli]